MKVRSHYSESGSRETALLTKAAKSCQCACSDPGCPACHGSCTNKAVDCLHRIDMEDKNGTPMCAGCAEDAHESGVFTSKPWNLRFHRLSTPTVV